MNAYKLIPFLQSESIKFKTLLILLRPAWLVAMNILGLMYGPVMLIMFVGCVFVMETQVSAKQTNLFENGPFFQGLGLFWMFIVIHSCIVSHDSYKFLVKNFRKTRLNTTEKV